MDTFYRYLPILVVLGFGLLINPFQEANAQSFQTPMPFQYKYQSGNVNDSFTTTQTNQIPTLFHFSPWLVILVLLIPAGYLAWNKFIRLIRTPEPVGRGYQITYQDIRPLKKRTFRISRKARVY